jgi:hypothetical protein
MRHAAMRELAHSRRPLQVQIDAPPYQDQGDGVLLARQLFSVRPTAHRRIRV